MENETLKIELKTGEFEARIYPDSTSNEILNFDIYWADFHGDLTLYCLPGSSETTDDIKKAGKFMSGYCRWRGVWEERVNFGNGLYELEEVVFFEDLLTRVFDRCKEILRERFDDIVE